MDCPSEVLDLVLFKKNPDFTFIKDSIGAPLVCPFKGYHSFTVSYSNDFDSGLQAHVSVGSHFVVVMLKFRNHNMFTPLRNTRYA